MTYNLLKAVDKNFHIDGKCSSCGICEKDCPVKNITLESWKSNWHGSCGQCLACIQWCPHKCIQYGKKTKSYERYHHPEVTVKDVMREFEGAGQ